MVSHSKQQQSIQDLNLLSARNLLELFDMEVFYDF